MGRMTGKTCRLAVMIGLTCSYFVVELVVGYVTNSLALISDSYHMLSDVIALIVGIASVRISRWISQKNTYGWARAEVLGALINSVFMLALCFTLLIEAVQRLVHPEAIEDPLLVLIVGAVGLAINLVGIVLFCGHAHGHSHGSHGHSHGGENSHGHSHEGGNSHGHIHDQNLGTLEVVETVGSTRNSINNSNPSGIMTTGQVTSSVSVLTSPVINTEKSKNKTQTQSASQMNMKGVFLHVLGDALGSVFVIFNALLMMFASGDWRLRVDPVTSIILIIILTATSIPLLRDSSLILLQTVPFHIRVIDLKEKLLQQIDGIIAVHEFHVWQLAGNRIIASAHILCQTQQQYMNIAGKVKQFFHEQGIHSTTIQPEFVEEESNIKQNCFLECGPDKTCFPDTCCNNTRMKEIQQLSGDVSYLRHRFINLAYVDQNDGIISDTRI